MSRRLRFGMQFDFRNPPQWRVAWPAFYDAMLEFAAWIETIGFDDVWFSEHHGAEDGYLPSPLVPAAAIATRTKRVRIGTAIALAPLYHPVRLAEDCAVLDLISNGRLDLALGLGYRAEEFAAYGVPMEGRGARTSEMLQIIRRLWDGETVTFKGQHCDVAQACIMPRPAQARPPLWVGGFNQPALRRAALYGDGVLGGGDPASRFPAYLDELRAAGKDESAARMIAGGFSWFIVSEDPDKTRHEVAPHVLHSVKSYAEWNRSTGHALYSKQRPELDVEALKANGPLKVVTPDEAIRIIGEVAERSPIEGIYGFIPPAGYPLPKLAEHVELLANKVIPAFR